MAQRMGNATRGNFKATMDHADIRGLVTALHRSVAGLPRSRIGDHPHGDARIGDHPHGDAHIALSRIPLTVRRASRCRSAVVSISS